MLEAILNLNKTCLNKISNVTFFLNILSRITLNNDEWR